MRPVSGPEQPDLFDRSDSALQVAFTEFSSANPQVYLMLRDLALEYQRAGMRAGIGHLYEIARHKLWLQTRGDLFKLNNNWRSRYARLLMKREPELAGYFDTRKLTG